MEIDVEKMIGIYFLIKENKVVYIGKSKDIHQRLSNHNHKFDDYVYIECDEELLNKYESYYITLCKPTLNVQHNVDWCTLDRNTGGSGLIKKIGDRKGLKLHEIAKRVGISNSQITKINSGEASVTLERIKQIAKALDVSFVELIELPNGYGYLTDDNGEIIGMVLLDGLKVKKKK